MYVCMYVCMFVYVYMCVYVCMYVCLCMYVCMYVCMYNNNTFILTPLLTESQRGGTYTVHNVQKYKN